jgi:hypothetical protein
MQTQDDARMEFRGSDEEFFAPSADGKKKNLEVRNSRLDRALSHVI